MSLLGETAAREAAEAARAAARIGMREALATAAAPVFAALALVAALGFGAAGLYGKLARIHGAPDAALIMALLFLLLAGLVLLARSVRAGRQTSARRPPEPEPEPERAREPKGPLSDAELAALVAATFRDAAEVGRDLRGRR
jgi:hypothetical protein